MNSSNATGALGRYAPAVIHSLKAVPTPPRECATVSAPKPVTVRDWLRFVAHEPFFQFIVLGFLIWGGTAYLNAHHNRYTIHLESSERQSIATSYLQQFGRLPTPEQLQSLTDRYIREEIFLREGLALHLEKDDEIVRRRIIQKYEFLQTDLALPESPPSGVLERWYERNKLRYLTPIQVAFSQVYFSPDRDGEEAAKVRAVKVLGELRRTHASRAPALGDAFSGPADIGTMAPDEAVRLFGQSDLSEQLFKLSVGQWAGPYRSGYGWHLIYVTGHVPPVLPPLSDVRERALADYMEEERSALNARNFEKLRGQYTIRYDGEGR
jgi:hypothetical protein